jgi:hypothetical protein
MENIWNKFGVRPLLMVFLIVWPVLLWHAASAQQATEKRYDFTATNEALSKVLDRLSQAASINFSYNSADASFAKPITYSARGKTIQDITTEILNLSGHGFRQIGNQLVVFPNEPLPEITDIQPDPLPNSLQEADTIRVQQVIVRDTIIKYETVTQLDTLIVRDTVFVEKEIYRGGRRADLKKISADIFRFEPNREDGWAINFHYGQHFGGIRNKTNQGVPELFSLVESTESASFRNYSLGSELLYNKGKWTISGGLQLTGFATRLKHNDIQSSGGYYRTDTISWYYTVVQTDTTWFPVTDSTYLPLNRREINYNQLNKTGYLDLVLGASYSFYSDANLSLYLKANLGAGFMIYNEGVLLHNKVDFPGEEYKNEDFNSSLFFYQIGGGLRYKAGNWFDVFGELSLRNYFGSIMNSYPIDRRYYTMGIKAGLIYYF